MKYYHKLVILISFIVLLVLLLLQNYFINAAQLNLGITQLSVFTSQGASVDVKVQTQKPSSSFPYKTGYRWGTELDSPNILITSIDVTIEDEKVFVPVSAYCDLTNPREFSLEKTKSGFCIIIEGGDAATSYKAVIFFENLYIKSRKVVHGKFPDTAWEETKYSFNTGS